MRNIKNIKNSTKDELIIAFLKSKNSVVERNFEKKLNDNNNTEDDTYDNRIIDKIHGIRMTLNKLGNIYKDRREIEKKIYKTEWKENLSEEKKEENYDYLVKLVRTLDNIKKI